ncbi:MAG: HEAT repeat domain-containing protein, partial [Sedimentisphaerales bacterium]|nr:HEAT repeat domain-containing protein [Sedimentisphaerales bacterium]
MRKVIWLSNACILAALALILFLPSCQKEADGADRPQIPPAERDRLLGTVRQYQFGQSRLDLTRLEEWIRDSYGYPDIRLELETQLVAVLRDPQATADGKQWVCRQLSLIGTEISAPVLGGLLLDPKLADMARYALERMEAPAAGSELRQALAKTDGAVRIGIINSLGQRRERPASEPLIQLLSNPDEQTAMAAARALGNIDGPPAIQALDQARKTASGTLRQAVVDAYLACAEQQLAEGDARQARQIYEQLYVPQESRRVRIAALAGMVAAGSPDRIQRVIEAVQGDDNVLQAAALSLVRDMPGAEMTGKLTGILNTLAPAGQAALLAALADRRDKAALPAVTGSVESDSPEVRLAALEALGQLGDASVVPLLARKAVEGPGPEQQAARDSLDTLADPAVDARMIELLAGQDAARQVELVRSLAARGAEAATPEILRLAQSNEAAVRKASYQSLGDLAQQRDLDSLLRLLVAAKGPDVSEAEKMVLAVIRRSPDAPAATSLTLAALKQADNPEVTGSLLRVLGRLGTDPALAAVQEALTGPAREAAIRVLGDWPNAKPATVLRDLARQSDDARQAILATRGYIRLIGLDSERPVAQTVQMYQEAMGLAQRPEEKRAVLSGLANLKSLEALQIVAEAMDQPALQAEAASAAVKIAKSLSGHRDEVRAAMQKVLEVSKNNTVRGEAEK